MPKYVVHVFLCMWPHYKEESPEKIPSGQPVEHDFQVEADSAMIVARDNLMPL